MSGDDTIHASAVAIAGRGILIRGRSGSGKSALVLGLIMMVIWWFMSPDFFRGRTLSRRSSADLLLTPATAVEPMFGLPDSGDMPTVIAPDLSNLPPGETALNPETGEEFTKTPQA